MKNILVVMNLQNGLINTPEKTALSQKIIELTRKHVFDRVVCVKFVNRDDGVFPKYHRYYAMHKGKEVEIVVDDLEQGMEYILYIAAKNYNQTAKESHKFKILKGDFMTEFDIATYKTYNNTNRELVLYDGSIEAPDYKLTLDLHFNADNSIIPAGNYEVKGGTMYGTICTWYSKFEIAEVGNRKRFRYTTKQAKFSQDNAIKQKALAIEFSLFPHPVHQDQTNQIPDGFVEKGGVNAKTSRKDGLDLSLIRGGLHIRFVCAPRLLSLAGTRQRPLGNEQIHRSGG